MSSFLVKQMEEEEEAGKQVSQEMTKCWMLGDCVVKVGHTVKAIFCYCMPQVLSHELVMYKEEFMMYMKYWPYVKNCNLVASTDDEVWHFFFFFKFYFINCQL